MITCTGEVVFLVLYTNQSTLLTTDTYYFHSVPFLFHSKWSSVCLLVLVTCNGDHVWRLWQFWRGGSRDRHTVPRWQPSMTTFKLWLAFLFFYFLKKTGFFFFFIVCLCVLVAFFILVGFHSAESAMDEHYDVDGRNDHLDSM